MKVSQIFNGTTTVESFIKKRCGNQLGNGCFRDVFELKEYPGLVAKIEKKIPSAHATFANVTEWRNYVNSMYWLQLKDWLAPCAGISDNGVILIQRKVAQKNFDKYPASIPNVFTDLKYENFGWIGHRFVCCDYSFFVQTSFRMKKAIWHGAKEIPL